MNTSEYQYWQAKAQKATMVGWFLAGLGFCMLCLACYIYMLVYFNIKNHAHTQDEQKAELRQMIADAVGHKAEK